MPPPQRFAHPELNNQIQHIRNLMTQKIPVYFINFGGTALENFHKPELQAIASKMNVQLSFIEPYYQPMLFFTSASLDMQQLNRLCDATTQAMTYGQVAQIANSHAEEPHAETSMLIDSFYSQPLTFSMQSNVIGDVMQHQAKLDVLSALQQKTGFSAPKADLTSPQSHLVLIFDVQSDPELFVLGFRLSSQLTSTSPLRYQLKKYALPSRAFLGPTSMDNELAALMCNMAQVKPGDLVFDPFCGTCSILVAATACGCVCSGADFDIKILRGKAKTYVDTFAQYKLPYPDLSWQDMNKPAITKPGVFDAVICDPPYSIRAASHIGTGGADFGVVQGTKELYLAMFNYAGRLLRVGGRLVFWLPVPLDDFDETDLMKADGMHPEHWPLQVLSSKYGRRLVCFLKTGECGIARYQKEKVCFDKIREIVGLE